MTSPILFCGQEDLSFTATGSSILASAAAGIYVDTTATRFRSGYARYALTVQNNSTNNLYGLYTANFGNQTSFWYSARVACNAGNSTGQSPSYLLQFLDSTNVIRIRVKNTSTLTGVSGLVGSWSLQKVDSSGAETLLSNFTASTGFSANPAVADKLDINMNYGASGSIIIYINGVSVCSFSGDTTTNSNTTLCQAKMGESHCVQSGSAVTTAWSEIMVASRDTRAMSLVTQVSTAFGNTHTFSNGAVANVNTNLANQATPDYSQSANQIEEYQVTPAIPAGSFSVVSVVQHGQCIVGSTGPQNIQFMVRTASTDYTSSTISPAPGTAWSLLTNNWDVNPNTSAAWATADLVNASVNYNFGYKSIT